MLNLEIGQIRREITSINLSVSSLEDRFRGTLTTLYGIQADLGHLEMRGDHIETCLGLNEANH